MSILTISLLTSQVLPLIVAFFVFVVEFVSVFVSVIVFSSDFE